MFGVAIDEVLTRATSTIVDRFCEHKESQFLFQNVLHIVYILEIRWVCSELENAVHFCIIALPMVCHEFTKFSICSTQCL